MVAVIGGSTAPEDALRAAEELGCRIIDQGWRLVTGGLGGVMEAASRGAHRASGYREGDVLGILPGADRSAANPWVDIVLPSGMGVARNVLVVSMAHAVVAVGGGAGTLSEMALAWQLGRPVVGLDVEGYSRYFSGLSIDERRPDRVWPARDPEQAVARLRELLEDSGPLR